jgi:glyoxylase-like metal-dependent hydrolase (beta-lactamase superfamily II)
MKSMRRLFNAFGWTLVLAACPASAVSATDSAVTSPQQTGAFLAEQLAEGIHLMQPASGRTELSNSLVVAREDGLLVVDAQASPDAARELLEAIGQISSKPVRYLVLSHAHAEAAGGASAFPKSTLVIGTLGARDALRDPQFDFGAEVRARSENPRRWEAPEIRSPVLVIHARTELEDPVNEVELLPLGHAHSPTDLMVLLPNQNILYAGAVLFPDRNPYAAAASAGGWLGVLNHISKIQPAVVIPLRGEPLDVRSVRVERDSLAWVRGQVELGFIEQVPPEQLTDWVLESEELGRHFDRDASPSFVRILIDRVVEDAVEHRKKRGLM